MGDSPSKGNAEAITGEIGAMEIGWGFEALPYLHNAQGRTEGCFLIYDPLLFDGIRGQLSPTCPIRLLHVIENDVDGVGRAVERTRGLPSYGFDECALLFDGAAFVQADMDERHGGSPVVEGNGSLARVWMVR